MLRCVIGDETAIVNSFIPESKDIKNGAFIVFFGCEAKVQKEHIEIQTGKNGRV